MSQVASTQSNYWPHAIIASFLIVISAGIVTFYLASSSDPGTIQNAYDKALDFDREQQSIAQLKAKGLSIALTADKLRIKIDQKFKTAEVSGAAASNTKEDFGPLPLEYTSNGYELPHRFNKGTWFFTFKFDDLTFSTTEHL